MDMQHIVGILPVADTSGGENAHMKMCKTTLFPTFFVLISSCICTVLGNQFERISRDVIDECDPLPWKNRIYAYDFDIGSDGLIHAVYSKPMPPNFTNDLIIYASGTAGNMHKTIIDTDGKHPTITAFIVVDRDRNNKVHICYNAGQRLGEEQFVYRSVQDGVISERAVVDVNAYHSRMQLDENGWPVFVREFSEGLRLFIPNSATNWSPVNIDTDGIADARIGDFVYDRERTIYHLLYGDNGCGASYSNSPYHRLWYAVSQKGSGNWNNEMVDDSCTLWENEFWVSLVLDSSGQPCVSMYKFATYNGLHNTGTSLLYSKRVAGIWQSQIIAGAVPGGQYPDHRAGMGVQSVSRGDAVFSFFDDSPDYPIDFAGEYGNIVLRHSMNGSDWDALQQIDGFSAEGYCRTKIFNNNLYLMVLGDFHDTKLYFYAYNLNDVSMLSQTLPVTGDFDGDGQAGCGVYYPPTGAWALQQTTDGLREEHFGYEGTLPVTGDFDGDGKVDVGCYYPPNGGWYLFKSRDGFLSTHFGYGDTVPVVADFDGDGKDDFGCYYPPSGAWDVMKSREGYWHMNFGYGGTYPVTADFDGDGKDDYGCYFPPDGSWYVMKSREGFWHTKFGYGGTLPVTADFDGDGKADFGCYFPPDGSWYVMKSRAGFWHTKFGFGETLPVTDDFDGDGKDDFGCYHPASAMWYLMASREGFSRTQSDLSGVVSREVIKPATAPVTGDFDGDGKDDFGAYYAPSGSWLVEQSRDGDWERNFGYGDTFALTGDYDGDGRLDFGCYYPPSGSWHVMKSREGYWQMNFGYGGTYPVTGDFDGDGKDDYGCYFPPDGSWYVMKSREGFWHVKFGYGGTYPVTADFDGDGKDDFGCYYPPDGSWHVMKSREGYWHVNFGYGGTYPVTGDFDGDGQDDFGCYFPPDGSWYFSRSAAGFLFTKFGHQGTLPAVADFDGDGVDDFGCYDADRGNWYLQTSTDGFRTAQTAIQ